MTEKYETTYKNYQEISHPKLKVIDKDLKKQIFKKKLKNFFEMLFPPSVWLKEYQKDYLKSDFIAGLTVGKKNIKQKN